MSEVPSPAVLLQSREEPAGSSPVTDLDDVGRCCGVDAHVSSKNAAAGASRAAVALAETLCWVTARRPSGQGLQGPLGASVLENRRGSLHLESDRRSDDSCYRATSPMGQPLSISSLCLLS